MAKKNYQNTFHEGLSMDMAKDVSKASTLSDANNAVIIPKGADIYELQNIKGNELKGFLPEGHIPKAIKVFNGIAYIISNKYGEDGSYDYTEIGTYPSPEWSALFPEQIEIVDYEDDGVTSLTDVIISSMSSDDTSANKGQTVHSFSFGTHPMQTSCTDGCSTIYHSNENFILANAINWAYHVDDGSSHPGCEDQFSLIGPKCYGALNKIFIHFEIFNRLPPYNDLTSTYEHNVLIDIIRVDYEYTEESNYTEYVSWDVPNKHYRIVTNYSLKDGILYKFDANNDPDPTYYRGNDLLSLFQGDELIHRSSGCDGSESDSIYIMSEDGNMMSSLPVSYTNKTEWIFVVKFDSKIEDEVEFKLWSTSGFTTRDGCDCSSSTPPIDYFVKSSILNTGNGQYLWNNGDSFEGMSSSDGNYNTCQSNWIDSANANVNFFEYPTKNRTIFARHTITPYGIPSGSCQFYGEHTSLGKYIAFKPYFTEEKVYSGGRFDYTYANISDTDMLEINKALSSDDKTLLNNHFTDSLVMNIAVKGVDIDDYRKLGGIPNDGTRKKIIGTNHEVYMYNKICIIKLDEDHIDDEFTVLYYNNIYNDTVYEAITDTNNKLYRRSIADIFEKFYRHYDDHLGLFYNTGDSEYYWLTDGSTYDYYDSSNTEKQETLRSYLELFSGFNSNPNYTFDASIYLDLYMIYLTAMPISSEYFHRGGNNGINLMTSIDVVSNISEYKSLVLDYIDLSDIDNDLADNDETNLILFKCANEGQKETLNFDLNNECCEDVKKNVLLHLSLSFDSSITFPVTVLFSSVYSYTGSIFKTFDPSNPTNEVILLFANVSGNDLELNITTDVDNVLDNLTIDIVKGYSYCLEDKYSHLKDKYCPLFNFNTDIDTPDIYLLDSQSSNYAFRSNHFIEDTDTDVELEINPSYDGTLDLIINDKHSKVKLVNSRFAYDPSNNRCFIPQKFGFNDDNVYSNRFIHGTELIRRTNNVLGVRFINTLNGGELEAGNYIYYFRYVDSNGNSTDIVNNTLSISVFNVEDDVANNTGEKAGIKTNAAVKLELSDFDRLYSYIEVSFVYSAGELNAESLYYKIDRKYNIPLADTLTIVHTGLEDLKVLNFNDVVKRYNHHESVKSITQGKKRLVLSNQKLNDTVIYDDIQKLAYNVTIHEKDKTITDDENFYKDASNIYEYTGYWRGETYQLGIVLDLIEGGDSPVFYFRGLDNIGKIDEYPIPGGYQGTTSINEFIGASGENAYGIYRTRMDIPITTQSDCATDPTPTHIHITYLILKGLRDFLNSDAVRSIAKGYRIVRKDRVEDVFLEGYVNPVYSLPLGPGLVMDRIADSTADKPLAIDASDHAYLDIDFTTSIQDPSIANFNSKDTKLIGMAPFGIIQMYIGDDGADANDDDSYGTYHGYVKGSPEHKHELQIFNALLNHGSDRKFGFVSADLVADAEHFVADFQGKGKFFSVNKMPTVFHLGNRYENGCPSTKSIGVKMTIDETNTYAIICRVNNHIKLEDMIMSANTEVIYVPEKVDASTDNSFVSKVDKTNVNFYTISYIGVDEADSSFSISDILRNTDVHADDNPYGYLARVYNNATGALSLSEWIILYSSKYKEGGYFPITPTYDINKPLNLISDNETGSVDDLAVFGGDCFINKVYLRTLTKNGLDDNFDSYSNIWDYTGVVGSVEDMKKPNENGPAANSWIDDSEFAAMKRAELVPKGMWVEVIHESKYNLALRTTQHHGSEDKFKYNKDRTFLPSLSKANSYIPAEISSSQMDSKGYNKGYSVAKGAVKYFGYDDVEKLLRVFYSRISASDISVRGELKNGYRELYGLNYKDYDTKHGYISKVITFNNHTFAIFERGIAAIPLSEKTQVTDKDGGVFIDNINVLGKELVVLTDTNGSIHPDSVIATKTGIYLFDHNNLAIIKVVGDNVPKDISAYKIERFLNDFKNKLKELRDSNSSKFISYNVKTNYDVLSGDIHFTFYVYEGVKDNLPDECIQQEIDFAYNDDNVLYENHCNDIYLNFDNCTDNGEYVEINIENPYRPKDCKDIPGAEAPYNILYQASIYYNERIGKWISPISFNPNFEFCLDDKTYSMNLIENQNRIHQHRSDNVNYCFFYDEQHNFSFEFIINHDQHVQKVLENLMITSNDRIPVTVSYDVDDKRRLADNISPTGERTRNEYNLDLTQDIKTRRFEVKIIGLSESTNYDLFLNTNDSLIHGIEVGYTFSISGTDYRIIGITSVLADQGIEMPRLDIEYFDGSSWLNVDTIKGSSLYEQMFGVTLRISKVSIGVSNSDYIEDHMYIQVQLKNTDDGWREIRDRTIKVKINYDGIDMTFIHSIISTVEQSLN